jgi:hypothetical protein
MRVALHVGTHDGHNLKLPSAAPGRERIWLVGEDTLARRMTPSQYDNWPRQQQTQYNQAVRRHNQEVDCVNRANKAAAEKYGSEPPTP